MQHFPKIIILAVAFSFSLAFLQACGTTAKQTSSVASINNAASNQSRTFRVDGTLAKNIVVAFNQAGLVTPDGESANLDIAGLVCTETVLLSATAACTVDKNVISSAAPSAIDKLASLAIFQALQAAGAETFVAGSSHDGGMNVKSVKCTVINRADRPRLFDCAVSQ